MMNLKFDSYQYETYLQIQRAITERRAWLIEMWLNCFNTDQLNLCQEWSERIMKLNDGEIMLEKNVEFVAQVIEDDPSEEQDLTTWTTLEY